MRILIVDDEPPAARGIQRLCEECLGREVESLKILGNVTASVCYIQEQPVDLLFLDIDLDGENGFTILEETSSSSYYTIITSSHTEYAVRAFEHSVLDFLPKPFGKQRFEQALERMRKAWHSRAAAAREHLPVKKDEMVEMVPLDQILYLVSDRNYTILHLADGGEERVRKTLDSMLELLPPEFVRAHKSCIVRKSEVQRILHGKNNTYRLLLKNQAELPLSRSMYARFKDGL